MNILMKPHTKKAISILKDLVAFPVLGGESNLSIAKYIEELLMANGVLYHTIENESGDKRAIHCRIGPAVDGGLILSGHMDVVPTKGQPWTRPDFELTQEGSKLYGRGTTDMKGFLACCLAIMPKLMSAPLTKPIYLAFSYDEEIGCQGGPVLVQDINDSYPEKPAFAIIGEPTSMRTVTGEKGIAIFKTIVISSAAHSSEIRSNVSAIEGALSLIQWLSNKMEESIEAGSIDDRFDPPYTTIHTGVIKGGTAVNIVADRCEFEWDVRTIPSDSVNGIVSDFKDYCDDLVNSKRLISPDFNIVTESHFPPVPGLDTPEDSRLVRLVNDLNGHDRAGTVSYGSEAGQYAEGGFEAILCGPGSMAQGHRADEFIEIEQLDRCIDFLENLTDSF